MVLGSATTFFLPQRCWFPSKVPASYGPTVSKPSFGPRQARLDETLEGLAVGFTPGKPKQLTWWKITPFFNRRYHLPWVGFFSVKLCMFVFRKNTFFLYWKQCDKS